MAQYLKCTVTSRFGGGGVPATGLDLCCGACGRKLGGRRWHAHVWVVVPWNRLIGNH